jgi:hypothetical protein
MKTWKQIAIEVGCLLEREVDDDHPDAPEDVLGEMQLDNEVQSTLAELNLMLCKEKPWCCPECGTDISEPDEVTRARKTVLDAAVAFCSPPRSPLREQVLLEAVKELLMRQIRHTENPT